MVKMVQPIEAEELALPVQCETNPQGWNENVVYDDISYPIRLVGGHMPREWAVDNLTAMGAGGCGRIIDTESQTEPWMVITLTVLLLVFMIQRS